MNDSVTLKSGYWWQWKNSMHKVRYKHFTAILADVNFSLRKNSGMANDSVIEYPYPLPRPHQCPRNESCMGGLDSSCALGYEGPLCEVCSTGYYKQLKTCQKCPTKKWIVGQISIFFAVVVVVIVIIVWISKKRRKSEGRSLVDVILGRLKIVIGFYQLMFGVLEAFSYVKWPDSLALIGKYSEVLQLSVFQIAPIHCLFPSLKVDAFGKLFVTLALNALAIIIGFTVYGIRKLVLRRGNLTEEQKLKKVSQTKELIYKNVFFFLFVTYLSTCLKTANVLPLACRTLCIDEKESNCHKFLKADYEVECTSPEFNRSVIVAFFAVGYIVLIPAVSGFTLWRKRSIVQNQHSDDENETADPQDQRTEVVTGLKFLFENYSPDSWYWELVETTRKVVLTCGMILVGSESRFYVGLACVLSGLYVGLFAYKKPMVDRFENKLMLSSLTITFVNLGIGAVSRIPEEGIPSYVDEFVDHLLFKALVFVANSLVIGLLVGEYKTYLFPF